MHIDNVGNNRPKTVDELRELAGLNTKLPRGKTNFYRNKMHLETTDTEQVGDVTYIYTLRDDNGDGVRVKVNTQTWEQWLVSPALEEQDDE